VLVEPRVVRLAICVPPKPKKGKRKVPMNSPREATKLFLIFLLRPWSELFEKSKNFKNIKENADI
jgi:hypothetical protein